MRRAVRFGEDIAGRIAVCAPDRENPVRQLRDPLRVVAVQPDHAHRPVDDARPDVLETGEGHRTPDVRLRHRECVAAALEMLVGENRAADDRQIGVGTDRVVREAPDELQQADERPAADLHRLMLRRKDNAVLVVVDIGRVLHVPFLTAQCHRDQADRLTGRMVHPARVAFILGAEQALRIGVLLLFERGSDRLGVLLRLREIDGDIEIAIAGRRDPFDVLCDPVAADVVAVAGQLVEIVRSQNRIFLFQRGETADHLAGSRREHAHDARVEEIPARDAVLDASPLHCVVEKKSEDFLEREVRPSLRRKSVGRFDTQHIEDAVGGVTRVRRFDQLGPDAISDQRLYCFLYGHTLPPSFDRSRFHLSSL